jgi:hypothetical protein
VTIWFTQEEWCIVGDGTLLVEVKRHSAFLSAPSFWEWRITRLGEAGLATGRVPSDGNQRNQLVARRNALACARAIRKQGAP